MDTKLIENEVKIAEDEGCIIFDFGCYFPYENFEILTFGFSLGMEEFEDYKINHRYPNKSYQTISKKYGRKISKIGYPYILKLNEQVPFLLCLKIGIKERCITLIFPIQTSLSKDKPFCGLSLHFNFDKSEFDFTTYEKIKKGVWTRHVWSNYESENIGSSNVIILSCPHRVDENSDTLIYNDIIKPSPSALLDLML